MNQTYCCDMMRSNIEHKCSQHENVFECPDHIIVNNPKHYGIIIHDGGPSYIQIQYCPWCGTLLR